MVELRTALEPARRVIYERAWLRVPLMWVDLLLMSFLAYEISLHLLLGNLGFLGGASALVGILALVMFMHGLLDSGSPGRAQRLRLELICPILLFTFLVGLQTLENPQKGVDFSFITTELIKLPFQLWLGLTSCTGFSVVFFIASVIMTIAWHRAPEHRWVRRAPRLFAWTLVAIIVNKLAFSWTGSGLGGFLANAAQAGMYVFIFVSAPGALAWFARRDHHVMAARIIPSTYLLVTFLLSYVGMIPFYGPGELLLFQDSHYIEKHEAVSIVVEPPNGALGRSFTFLRHIQRTDDHLFASYGPSCGIIRVDLATEEVSHLHIPGLFRDMKLQRDPERLWALNWRQADLLLIDQYRFEVACRVDLFANNIPKPHTMAWDGDTLYLTNGTPPRLFELKTSVTAPDGGPWEGGPAECNVEVVKMVDLHEVGYTPYNDEINYGFFHAPTRKIYVSAGILEQTYLMGLVEIDADTFEITNDLRLPAGGIFFNEATDTFILPSFYYGRMFEATREDLTLLREFPSDPRSFRVEYDAKRRLLYATSRISGTLRVIDYDTGETLHNLPVGAKAAPLYYDQRLDVLFTGGASGIVRVDLARLLGPRPSGQGGADE